MNNFTVGNSCCLRVGIKNFILMCSFNDWKLKLIHAGNLAMGWICHTLNTDIYICM